MSNRNPDGTYTLPDASVSLVWQSDKGKIATCSVEYWVLPNGEMATSAIGERWLPWTPPTFPARKKVSIRRCIGKCEQIGFGFLVMCGDKFFCPSKRNASAGWWLSSDAVEVVQWLDPEYEDETPGMENLSNGVQIESSK